MGIDRILKVDLDTAINLLEGFKWKFYEELNDHRIRVEVPRNSDNIVIYVKNTRANEEKLQLEGFVKQEIKPWRQY